MKKIIPPLFLFLLTGCGTKQYYTTMQETNESIALANSEMVQTCSDAIQAAKTPEAVVAIALTACRESMPLQKVEAPEKPSKILREVVYGTAVGGIFFGPGASQATSNHTDVGGDYTQVTGSGSSQKTKHESFEYHLEVPNE
jgi:hypothetical protein